MRLPNFAVTTGVIQDILLRPGSLRSESIDWRVHPGSGRLEFSPAQTSWDLIVARVADNQRTDQHVDGEVWQPSFDEFRTVVLGA